MRQTENRHLIDRQRISCPAIGHFRVQFQRMNDVGLRLGKPFGQVVGLVLVHEETDRSPVHSVDRDIPPHEPVQRLQHQAVAAKRDDGVCVVGVSITVSMGKIGEGFSRFLGVAGDEVYIFAYDNELQNQD